MSQGRPGTTLRAAVFDLFDTLIAPPPEPAWRALAAAHGYAADSPVELWLRRGLICAPLLENAPALIPALRDAALVTPCATAEDLAGLATSLGGEPGPRAIATVRAAAALVRAESRLAPGADHVLERCRALGLATAIVSNVDGLSAGVIDQLGLLARLSVPPVTSCNRRARKPAPALFAHAAAALGVAPADCVMIGDNWKSDVVGALRAGMASIWLWGGDPIAARLATGQLAELTEPGAPARFRAAYAEVIAGYLPIAPAAALAGDLACLARAHVADDLAEVAGLLAVLLEPPGGADDRASLASLE
ncbi:MAG TPA: HAD-IA family hydrolase [Kofleriaceae bacterium]|nr:HAD-IA family hydrolase [Kofleriaceae bacterium]